MGRRKEVKHAKPPHTSKRGTAFLDPIHDEVQALLEEQGVISLPMIIKKGKNHKGGWTPGNATMSTDVSHSYGGTTQQTYYSGNYKQCEHKGDVPVFEAQGKKLFAASWQGLNEYSNKYQLIIDLAGNVKPITTFSSRFVKTISTYGLADLLEKYTKRPAPKEITAKLLSLDWPDMNAAPVGLDFWLDLWASLPENTIIACQGGHGRTGTCLVALIMASGELDYFSALEEVRAQHCTKAVETLVQEVYLYDLQMEILKRSYAAAIEAGNTTEADDIAQDIQLYEKSAPTAKTSVGSKTYNYGSSSHTPNIAYGEVLETRQCAIGGGWEDHRCVRQGCVIVHCEITDHLAWIKRVL